MGTEGAVRVLDIAAFASALLSQRELSPRARQIASLIQMIIPDSGVVVYVLEDTESGSVWRSKATVGELKVDATLAANLEVLQGLAVHPQFLLFDGAELAREAYAHLDLRRTVVSWALLPILLEDSVIAAVEIVSFSEAIRPELEELLSGALRLSSTAIAASLDYERERNSQLQSISRMTQFYDLEKTFNATIEIEELLPIIASKFREILNVQAVNLWMVESSQTLLLTNSAGEDPTMHIGSTQQAGEGHAFDVSESGEPSAVDSADERLAKRNGGVEAGAIFSLMAAPLLDKEHCVGVAEIINRLDGQPFDEDDLFLLTTICETASGALHNAALLQSERKAQILQTLVDVSSEITSTLNLDRVLQTIVNGPQAVIPYERSAIALERNGQLQLRAVSGMLKINFGEPSVIALRNLVEWLSFTREDLTVQQHDEQITGSTEQTKESFRHYFAQTGVKGFHARLLNDDQGRLGLLVYESSDPDFLSSAHIELIKILSGQATVALRNAQLYQEVPFINVIGPIMERKRKFMGMDRQRRVRVGLLAAAVVLFLLFFPVPLRIAGDVNVTATRTAMVQPEFDGVVKRVLVREGDAVRKGSILAEMDDWEFRRLLAEAEAKYSSAVSEMNRALAANDGTTAGVQRANVALWSSEAARLREKIERAKLRSPVDGVVTTPFVENFTGRKLDAGEKFAEIADTSHAVVDVAVEEQDVPLLQAGMSAGVKLDSYPTKTFRGNVLVISPKSEPVGDQRMFYARVDVPNPDRLVKPGMQGTAKIWTGWKSAGYVMFRRPGMWMWGKLWSWFGF
ncbi:MAG TPA: efflux RND transporter periplasmic adaptor subunit [Terriglobales bacterium]|nr:efflux RND transporter periplasmic adaptor subunit [Terriglobales bacterium]